MVISVDAIVYSIWPSLSMWFGSVIVIGSITGITFADKVERSLRKCCNVQQENDE